MVPEMNQSFDARIAERLNQHCKPPGSLGVLEWIAARLCQIQKTLHPATSPRHVTIFAADHGVTCEGVSAWPSEVTGAVAEVMGRARTASGVFARALHCSYEVVDVGLLKPCSSTVLDAAGRRSTGSLLQHSAMTPAEFDHVWRVGVERSTIACDAGSLILIGGEMGIGNTTSASCLIGLLCGAECEAIVGRGAGIDDAGLARKREVVENAMRRVRSRLNMSALSTSLAKQIACDVGGFEIVALAGFYSESAARGRTILIDGQIATSAAVLAEAMLPGTRDCMIAGHRSTEPGHMVALEKLQLSPILDLQMRLGEGSGALAALPLLDLAAAMMNGMASLSELDLR